MRLVRHLGCLLLGAVVGLASLLEHRSDAPLGLLLALTTTFATAWWLRGSRSPRTLTTYAVGWVVVVGAGVAGRPEGDYLLAQDARGLTLLAGGFVLLVLGVVSLAGSRGPTT